MKLDSYELKEALSRREWMAAEVAMCRYFGIAPPDVLGMRVLRHYSRLGISLWNPAGTYEWFEGSGFRLGENPLSSGHTTIIFWGPQHPILGAPLLVTCEARDEANPALPDLR